MSCVALAFACLATMGAHTSALAVESDTERDASQTASNSAVTATLDANTVSGSPEADQQNEASSTSSIEAESPSYTPTEPISAAPDRGFLSPKQLTTTILNDEGAAASSAEQDNIPTSGHEFIKGGVVKTLSGDIVFDENEEFELIFEVRRKSRPLSRASTGIQKGAQYYLPMIEIMRLTKIVHEADFTRGTVKGYISQKDNSFELNSAEKYFIRNGGQKQAIPDGAVIAKDFTQGLGEIYVEMEFLNTVLDLGLVFDTSSLLLDITTPKSLPDDLAEERATRQSNLGDGEEANQFAGLKLKNIPNNYRMLSAPAVNISARSFYSEIKDDITNNINLNAQHDLLGTQAQYGIGLEHSTEDGFELRNARLTMTRRDYGQRVLPFGLKSLSFGDVSVRPSGLIDGSIRGRGVVVSNTPYQRFSTFDTILINGYAQPGWEVELYNNEQLIDFGRVSENGEYIFEDIRLRYGRNSLKVVLYGPEGQREEREESYQISGQMIPAGEIQYEAGIIDANNDLIQVDDRNEFLPKGLAYHARAKTGISDWISGFATLTRNQTDYGGKDYASAGVNFSALNGAGQIEAYKQFDGGTALDARYLASFSGFRFNARATSYQDFESEEAGYGVSGKKREWELGVDKAVNTLAGRFGLSLDFLRRIFKDETQVDTYATNINTSIKGVQLQNTTDTNVYEGKRRNSKGTFSVSSLIAPRLSLRSRLSYDIYPAPEYDALDTELRYHSLNNKLTTGLNFRRNLLDKSSSISVDSSYNFGTFLGGFDLGWADNRGLNFGLRASTSIAPFGKNGEYIASSENMLGRGRVRGRVYEDKNMNGVFDEGDVAVENASFKAGSQSSEKTDKDGYATIESIGGIGPMAIVADAESFEDPFLRPSHDGYSMIVRPTTFAPFVDFPLVMTGTIDGNVYFANNQPAPGLIVQLINPSGQVVQETTTAFDGFYTFEYVKPATYIVRASPSHQVSVPPETVTITSDDLFAYGVDLHFVEQEQDVSVAEDSVGESGRVAQNYHAPATGGTEKPAPRLSSSGFQTAVRAVRIGEYSHRVRLVLDLSGQSGYFISTEDEGHTINIDLPSTAWNVESEWNFSNNPYFEFAEALALMDKDGQSIIGSRLRLKAHAPLEVFYNADLPPAEDKGYRVYVDLIKKK